MNPDFPMRPLCFLLLAMLVGLAGCGSYEDKRIHELLVEKGFGTRASGDASRENYIGGRDLVQFTVPVELLTNTATARLAELTAPQPVGLDGTIYCPHVGPVYVLGKTEAEAAALLNQQLAAVLGDTPEVQARIIESGKWFYAYGEVALKGQVPLEPDLTLFDAMNMVRWTPLANLGRVQLIRPDAEHPLVVDINFREMVTTGLMRGNIGIRERDILYVPPTFFGLVARLLERLLTPLGLAVQSVLGLAQAQTSYQVLTGDRNAIYFRY